MGVGNQATGSPFATELRWAGAAGGDVIVVRGPIAGVQMSDMKFTGMDTSGDLLRLIFVSESLFSNLIIGRGGNDSVGLPLDHGTSSNLFENPLLSG